MIQREATSSVADIKAALASPTTCDSSTYEALTTFLTFSAGPTSDQSLDSQRKNEGIPLATKQRFAKATQARVKKEPGLKIKETHLEYIPPRISSAEKVRLATEVVNIGLKALTATVKKVASTNLDAHLKHQDRISGSRSVEQPLASTALSHDRLANRQTQKPAANSGIKKSFPNTASTPPGTWIAECTKLALATLRRPSEGTNGDIKLPPFQIEMGMSAFIGKLIALDMLDTASKELKVLMHRICVKRTKEQMVSEEVSSECLDSKTGKLILADLLRMSTIPDNPQALSLLISSHIHILKILGLRRRPGGIEQAFEHIQLSSNVSPVNAIEQSIQKNSPEARAKATNQFETLARSISSLTPSLSLSEDARAVDNRISASPYHCLNLFMLSLQIKWKAWLLSNHQIDLRREVFEPFRSAIQAFNRRAKFEPKAKIEAIKAASQILSNLMTLGASSYLNSHDYSRSRIDTYKVLSEIAREGQDLDASLRWMSASLQLLNETNPSDAKRASLLCQLGSLELRKSLEEPNSEYTGIFVQDAISSLKGNFQGTSLELDELLKAVSSFRKSATLVALESTRSPNVDKKPRNGLENLCRQIVILGLRFMIRFLGKEPGPASQDSAVSRYQQRLELCIKVGRPTIEAVIALARLPSSFEEDVMRSIEDALIDCAQLASQLEPRGTSMRTSPEKSDRHSIWVLLSNVYWSRYLDMKRKGVGSSKLIQMVHSSVEYLLDCSPSEQETAFFSAKAETLGLLFDTSRDWQKAMQYYARSLNHMIEGGILCAMRGNAVSLPLLRVISEGQTVSPFNRILTAYTKALSQAIVEGDRVALFFDDQKLHPEERGIFLEAQLATLIAAKNHCPSPRATSVSKLIVENLLELFNQEDYPIRRLRVVSRIMRFHLIDSTIFEPNFIAELASENPKSSPGNDVGLEKFRSHIGGCRDAWFALSHGNAKLDLLKSTLVTWSSIFSNEQDWKAIQERVDDISEWITLLDSIADLFHMQGFELERASALNFAATACKLQPSASSANCVSKLSALGLQLSRLGHSRDSGKTLQKARQIIDSTDIPIMVRLQWHLAYAEYLIEIGNLAKAEDYVERAKDLFAATLETALRPASSKDQYNQTWIAGELMHVLSIRAIARGRSAHAIYFARKSIRMTSRAWALLDHRIANGKGTGNDSSKNSLEAITGNIMSMSISAPGPFPVMSTKHESLKSYPFWPLVPRLFHRLLHVSALLSHEGLLPEAQFYASRAAKISEAVQAHHLRASILTTQGGYNVNGGDLSRGVEELKEADGIVADLAPTLTNVRLQLNLASAYANLQEDDEERGALQAANKILQTLLFAVFIGKQPQPSRAVDEIAEQIQSLNLDEKLDKPKPRARAKTVGVRLPKKAPVKAPMKVEPKQLEPPESPATERSPLLQMRGQVLRQSAESELRKGMFDSAQTHLRDAEQLPLSSKTSILQALGVARLLLRQGLDGLLTDPVFNVLQESTISCPSAGPAGRRASRDLGKQQAGKPDSQGRARKGRPAKRVIESQIVPTHAFTRVLCECLEKLNANHELAQSNGTSSMTHKVTDALSKTLMMLSAACSTDPSINISPAFTAYAMELARSSAMMREASIVQIERILGSTEDSHIKNTTRELSDQPCIPHIDPVTFQADYIDIIPEQWTVVSLSVSEERDELRLSRLRSGHAPFILSIPLNRHISRDCDEEIFGFDEGKAELLDIIGLANFSTHEKRDFSKKGAKSEWWEARGALDARLKDLLVNIENIWFGGFRGILAQDIPTQELLSRFQQSFYKILGKHLPSRRKMGKAAKLEPVTLDSRVLELFTGLGMPQNIVDLDEPLMDLLYFVVDILQFHGERNAYDEIDFDHMVIETREALAHYHKAAHDEAVSSYPRHTILIIDKALHAFPWESMPCMVGQAVSRVPSLSCLRDRIVHQQKQPQQSIYDSETPGFKASASDGAYILNPAGDLVSTESSLLPHLSQLTSWTPIINKEPTESEISSQLSSRSIYLYFGHGSGGQYIRSCTVKKLESCAVALLMGCSSGAMTEAGEYESYGTPISYMHAGAPAVVGTLWDVTDKDIDRFSVRALQRWGLFLESPENKGKRSESPTKRSMKGKGKGRAKVKEYVESEVTAGNVSLDKAVAEARESCILRYLNGAAPVVYGVPVYLA